VNKHKNKHIRAAVDYHFTVVLADCDTMTPDLTEALHEAGCDDGTPWSGNGMAVVTFDRDAESLDSAIRSAVADVQKAGCTVKHAIVESPEPVV
jgi:hypothetical protein